MSYLFVTNSNIAIQAKTFNILWYYKIGNVTNSDDAVTYISFDAKTEFMNALFFSLRNADNSQTKYEKKGGTTTVSVKKKKELQE